jgi:TetR/AcrR family transcriptional repressor of mexJK operon
MHVLMKTVDAAAAVGSGPGRPRDEVKRARIIETAQRMFFERGFEGVSMEAVASEAGVAKLTVYRNFADKYLLFEAVMRNHRRPQTSDIGYLEDGSMPLRQALVRYGSDLLAVLTSSELVAVDRLLAVEASRHPEFARRFFAAGPGRSREVLASALVAASRRGEFQPVSVAEARMYAGQWLALLLGFGALELRFGLAATPRPEELAQQAEQAVATFLDGCGAARNDH